MRYSGSLGTAWALPQGVCAWDSCATGKPSLGLSASLSASNLLPTWYILHLTPPHHKTSRFQILVLEPLSHTMYARQHAIQRPTLRGSSAEPQGEP